MFKTLSCVLLSRRTLCVPYEFIDHRNSLCITTYEKKEEKKQERMLCIRLGIVVVAVIMIPFTVRYSICRWFPTLILLVQRTGHDKKQKTIKYLSKKENAHTSF